MGIGGPRDPWGASGVEKWLGLKEAMEHSPDHSWALANFSEQLLPVGAWLARGVGSQCCPSMAT